MFWAEAGAETRSRPNVSRAWTPIGLLRRARRLPQPDRYQSLAGVLTLATYHGRLIQTGSPEEIYLNPATASVARCTGLAGGLAVHIHGPSTGRNLQVRLGDRLVEARALYSLHEGMPTQLMVRPSAGAPVASSDGRADFLGVVRDVAFRGRAYEHVVALAGGRRLHSLFSESKWDSGEQVGVKRDAAQCLLLEPEPSPDSGDGPLAAVSTAAKVTPSPEDVLLEGVG